MPKFNVDVQPGDMAVMMPAPGDWVGTGISWFAGPYSHVTRVVSHDGMCIDANPPCVRQKHLTEYLADGRQIVIRRWVDWRTVGEFEIKRRLDNFLNPLVDAEADYAERKIFRFALRLIVRWLPSNPSEGTTTPHVPAKWHCAELFCVTDDYCFHFDPVPERAHKWTCPTDLAESKLYKTVTDKLVLMEA